MEEDLHEDYSKRETSAQKRVLERLEKAVEAAAERQAFESAHDEELLKALDIVANFIRKRKRVCYGGTAMNMILSPSKRFYDPNVDLPDYDFYTPALDEDVEEIVRDLKAAGFKEVYHRVGIHEGTKKILVNFVAVADISAIDKELFKIFYERSIERDGVHYTDPDILRMMMYLELSRPRGQVERWSKVFERLELINKEFPIELQGGAAKGPAVPRGLRPIPFQARSLLLEFIKQNQRVLCSGPLIPLYRRGIENGNALFESREGGALLFLSPDPRSDANLLKRGLASALGTRPGALQLFLHRSRGEIVPERLEIRLGGRRTLCVIVQEVACHSFNAVPTTDDKTLLIGSPEFLITLYLSMIIFTRHAHDVLGWNGLAQVRELIALSEKNHSAKRSQFPPFSLSCKGHQTGYASLIRAKVLRIAREKDGAAGRISATRRGRSRSSGTRRQKR
jgi:hypothetical protein